MAPFAGISGGPEILHGGRDRCGIAMEGDLDKLLGAVHFSGEISGCARANVALNTFHMRVGGDLIGGVFRVHYVA